MINLWSSKARLIQSQRRSSSPRLAVRIATFSAPAGERTACEGRAGGGTLLFLRNAT